MSTQGRNRGAGEQTSREAVKQGKEEGVQERRGPGEASTRVVYRQPSVTS